jgi:ferritin-like protein
MDKAQFRIETYMIAYYYMITDMEITDTEKRVASDILCSALHTTQP